LTQTEIIKRTNSIFNLDNRKEICYNTDNVDNMMKIQITGELIMKKSSLITKLTSTVLIAFLVLTGCSGKSDNTTVDTTASQADSSDQTTPDNSTSEPSSSTLVLTCGSKTASGDGSVELSLNSRTFKEGNTLTLTVPEGQHYIAFCLAKDVVSESILYLTDSTFTYTIPKLSISYPTGLSASSITVTARIPETSELTDAHNLALNPADLLDPDMNKISYTYSSYWDAKTYPHATTSTICRYASDETSKYQFEVRNAIDGFTQNTSHGSYPYQSWGPDSGFTTRDYIAIDFGHEVKVDTLALYIRADFPHDTYYTSMTVKFSDGTSQTFDLTNSSSVQEFDLGGITTSYIKITKLTMQDSSGWAGFTEVEVIGSEIIG
jgi:hypothetical protein